MTITAHVASNESAQAVYEDAASIFSSSTTDPNSGNDTTSDPVNLVTRANLVAGTLTAVPVQPVLFANSDQLVNAVTYTFTFTNNGPSYARTAKVTDVLSSESSSGPTSA